MTSRQEVLSGDLLEEFESTLKAVEKVDILALIWCNLEPRFNLTSVTDYVLDNYGSSDPSFELINFLMRKIPNNNVSIIVQIKRMIIEKLSNKQVGGRRRTHRHKHRKSRKQRKSRSRRRRN